MRNLPQFGLRRLYRWAILLAVGLFGLLITGWVGQSLTENEHDRMEQRFQLAARARAAQVIALMRQPEDHLATLQRLFGSVDRVGWPAFRKFTRPTLDQHGVRSYNGFPRAAAGDRAAFERDSEGKPIAAAANDQYFPLLYSLPEELGRRSPGVDLLSIAARAADQAGDRQRPTQGQRNRAAPH